MGQRIIIAEDDPSIQMMFRMVLSREGYEIEVSPDANFLYDRDLSKPNLFILDRQLKNSDGLEACRYLKSNDGTRDIPVIIISATPEIGILARNAGAEAYLEKPFSIQSLLEKIRSVLNRQ